MKLEEQTIRRDTVAPKVLEDPYGVELYRCYVGQVQIKAPVVRIHESQLYGADIDAEYIDIAACTGYRIDIRVKREASINGSVLAGLYVNRNTGGGETRIRTCAIRESLIGSDEVYVGSSYIEARIYTELLKAQMAFIAGRIEAKDARLGGSVYIPLVRPELYPPFAFATDSRGWFYSVTAAPWTEAVDSPWPRTSPDRFLEEHDPASEEHRIVRMLKHRAEEAGKHYRLLIETGKEE